MLEHELLGEWFQSKRTSGNYFRLSKPVQVEFEFKGPQWGHPSNYALVSFYCEPSDELVFTSTAGWPPQLRIEYTVLLERAIRLAIVDGLFAGLSHYHRGCALTLDRIAYDTVMSSEQAFYRATRRAMDKLITDQRWSLITV